MLKKIFSILLVIASVASATTVHYDKRSDDSKKNVVKYSEKKVKTGLSSKANHPHNSLYNKK